MKVVCDAVKSQLVEIIGQETEVFVDESEVVEGGITAIITWPFKKIDADSVSDLEAYFELVSISTSDGKLMMTVKCLYEVNILPQRD